MPTTNAVPSADPSDMLFNAQKLDEVINGSAESFFDRRGVERLTLTGALRLIGFEAPVAFTTGLSITRATQTVTNSGNTYHADPASLPFTTTGTFNGAQWRLVSNVTQADLTTYAIPRTGATDLTASFKTAGTWEAAGFRLDTNAVWSIVSSNPAWQADSGDLMSYDRTANKWSYSIASTEKFYVTAADGPARGDDASTSSGLPRKAQVETMVANAVAPRMQFSLSAAQSTTSGTAVDFTAIPSWAKRITILFKDVSTNGTAQVGVQLGTSSGIQSTGYAYSATYSNSAGAAGGAGSANAAAFLTTFTGTGQARTGALLLHLASANTWCASGNLGDYSSGAATVSVAGVVQLGATLDRLRITTANGSDAFDNGSVTLLIEG